MDRIQEWAAFIGRRNIAYVVFVSLLVPFGMLMEAAGPHGPDSGGGIIAAIILWGAVSLIFFIANAGLVIGSLAGGRSAIESALMGQAVKAWLGGAVSVRYPSPTAVNVS